MVGQELFLTQQNHHFQSLQFVNSKKLSQTGIQDIYFFVCL
jgi:hypothetical protein